MSIWRDHIQRQWYGQPHWLLLLAPLSLIFWLLSKWRRRRQTQQQGSSPLPVVVVGNIAVGGTGKTPIIIALVAQLQALGWRPGVIASGYGAAQAKSRLLPANAAAEEFGDEPVMIAARSGCPVAVGPVRTESVLLLARHTDCNIVLSDDGLQHYRLPRIFEIAVVDAARGCGNGWLLPVGPLRERPSRLREVDMILINGGGESSSLQALWRDIPSYVLTLAPVAWINVKTRRRLLLDELDLTGASAIAGIGNPRRFFQTLVELGFSGATESFADHHRFALEQLQDRYDQLLLMTEKDAVKCASFAGDNWWALVVEMPLPEAVVASVAQAVRSASAVPDDSIRAQ